MVVKGFVLAGGKSSRFGEDKALVPVQGRPMVVWVAEALKGAGLPVQLVVREGMPLEVDLPLLHEPSMQGFHPLHGLAWALKSLQEDEWALCAPCDLPYLRTDGVEALLSEGRPAVASDGVRVHPLLALLPACWLGRVEGVLERGGSATEVFDEATRVVIPEAQLINVNRPEDLVPAC